MSLPNANRTLSARPKLTSIEVARGLAATLVIFHHVSQHLTQELGAVPYARALEPGHAAVDFFYVLSGFLILFVSESSIGRPKRLGTYAKKRLLRIFPIYWVSLAMFVALHSVSSSPPVSLAPGSIVNDFFLWPRARGADTINGISWSLSYEVCFYLLFGTFLLHRQLGRLVFALWSGAALLQVSGVIDAGDGGVARLMTSEYVLLFPLGMAIAVRLRSAPKPPPGPLLGVGVAVLVIAWCAEVVQLLPEAGAFPRMVYGIGSAITIYGLVAFDRAKPRSTPRFALLIGECSYSIYLFHYIGIAVAAKANSVLGLYGRVPAEVLALGMIATGLTLGLVMGVLVERPLVRWARGVTAKPEPAR